MRDKWVRTSQPLRFGTLAAQNFEAGAPRPLPRTHMNSALIDKWVRMLAA